MARSNPLRAHGDRRGFLAPIVIGVVIMTLILPAVGRPAPPPPAAPSGWGPAIRVDVAVAHSGCSGAGQVDVASSPRGDITVVWPGYVADSQTYVLCSRRKPLGKPWLPVEKVWEGRGYVTGPRVVADGNGGWLAAWVGFSGVGTQVMASHYTRGAGWGRRVGLSPRTSNRWVDILDLDLVMNADGDAAAVWEWGDFEASEPEPRAQFNYRPAHGHWQGVHQLKGSYQASVAIGPGGDALVLTSEGRHILVVRHHGKRWLQPRRIAREAIWSSAGAVALTGGGAVATWPTVVRGKYVVRASRLVHGSWSTPRSLSRRIGNAWSYQLVAGLSRRGDATIAWGRGSRLFVSGVTESGRWKPSHDAVRFGGWDWELAMSPAGDMVIASNHAAIYRPVGRRWRDRMTFPSRGYEEELGVAIDNRGRASVVWAARSSAQLRRYHP